MTIPQTVIDLENRSVVDGEATLSAAYSILEKLWRGDFRDRELALHLMFLSWYGIVEPEHITGFPEDDRTKRELNNMLASVHSSIEPTIHKDAEMLYAVGLAAHMFWFMFDDSSRWQELAADYRVRYRTLTPNGLDPADFDGRGAYGAYYGRQAAIVGGY